MQQCLKVCKEQSGLQQEQMDVVRAGFRWAVEVKGAEGKCQEAQSEGGSKRTQGAACAAASSMRRRSPWLGGGEGEEDVTKIQGEQIRQVFCTHAHEEHWKQQEQERKNIIDEFMERLTDHLTGKGSVRKSRAVQGIEEQGKYAGECATKWRQTWWLSSLVKQTNFQHIIHLACLQIARRIHLVALPYIFVLLFASMGGSSPILGANT